MRWLSLVLAGSLVLLVQSVGAAGDTWLKEQKQQFKKLGYPFFL